MRRLIVDAAAWLAIAISPATFAQTVISVPPSGGDDTATIQAAFDAAASAGPGSTVRLEEGNYCLYSPLIVRGFSGSWIGAGKALTTVKTCAPVFPVPMDIEADPAHPADPLLEIKSPIVFIEVDGRPAQNIHIGELTVELEGETNQWFAHGRAEPLTLFRPAISIHGHRPTKLDGIISSISLTVDRINMIGNAEGLVFGLPSVSNMDNAIEVIGGFEPGVGLEPVQADIAITRSHFERVAFSALQIVDCTDCNITFGGRRKNGNTSSLNFGGTVFATIVSGSSFLVSHNTGETQWGAVFRAYPSSLVPAPSPSRIIVAHNTFDLFQAPINASFGIELLDIPLAFSGTPVLNAVIEKNTFGQTDIGFGAGPSFGIRNFVASGTVIRNNRFSGDYGVAAIAAGYFDGPPEGIAKNLVIKGNNLADVKAQVAPIWLGPYSSDSVVVGGPNNRHVFDQGYDNIVTGVNNTGGKPPGPRLQELMNSRTGYLELLTQYQARGLTGAR